MAETVVLRGNGPGRTIWSNHVEDWQTAEVGEIRAKDVGRQIQFVEQLVLLAIVGLKKVGEVLQRVLWDRSFILNLREGHVAGLNAKHALVLLRMSCVLSMTYRNNGESAYHAIRKRFELLPDVQLHFSEMVCNRCRRDSCECSVALTSEARDPIGDGVHDNGYRGDSVPPNLVFIQNIFRAQLEELVVAEEEQE